MNVQNLPTLRSTRTWGGHFSKNLRPGDVVCLDGPLGAGKTTLAQAIARGLGVDEPVTSPTYALIHEYSGTFPVYHMDLYRLSGAEEFELIGGPDYFEKNGVCLIEWSRRIREILPERTWVIEVSLEAQGRRALWGTL